MKKRIFILSLITLILFTSLSYAIQDKSKNNSENYNFIFVCTLINNPYWENCIEGIKTADKELGTKTKTLGSKDASKFLTEIVKYMRQAIDENPDGIITYAGIEEITPLIDEATQKGIPVLAIDSDAPNSSRVAFVGTNDYNAGYDAGEKMVELTKGKAKVGVLVSSKSAKKEIHELEAFRDVVSDYDIEIVAVEETFADINISEEKTRQMLKEHPEITAMFNTSDYNVTGAARVKKELNLKNLILIGFDDIDENIQFVREGIIDVILVQKIKQIGYQSIYLMDEYLNNGFLPQKTYDAGTILVTKENVDTYNTQIFKQESSVKSVRVGYYSGNSNFQNGFDKNSRKSGYAYEYYQAISDIAGWSYEYVYGSKQEVLDLLKDGKVDIVAGIYETEKLSNKMLFSKQDMGMDGIKQYFVVNKDRPDIYEDLNNAMEQIQSLTPNYTTTLFQKYYSKAAQQILTDTEKAWLRDKGILKVGYVRKLLPLSDEDLDGNPTGVIKDLIDIISQYTRISIEPVAFDTIQEMEDGLLNNTVDTIFPVYSDLWINESKGLRQTDSFINDRAMIVYNGEYTDDLMDRIAISKTGTNQKYYMDNYYPNAEVVFYDSRYDILKAIENGTERCTISSSSVMQNCLKEHLEFNNLNIAYLDTSENFGMAVRNDESMLLGILNKTIRQTGNATITSSMIKNSDIVNVFSFKNFLQHYYIFFIAFFSIFSVILIEIFILYLKKTKKYEKEQKKTNNALKKALSDANMANEAKTNFLSSISHDIRTPMNAIIGMTSIANNHVNDQEKVMDCLKKIELSSNHLLTLINNVLDISKIESGKLQLNPINFSLKNSVNTMLDILKSEITSKKLQFDLDFKNVEYENFYADEVRINQVFMNILTNAIKYTPSGGKITIGLDEELLDDNKTVRVTYIVEDTGIGMSKEFMQNMYQTFSRAQDSRISRIQGTGLGLAIVKQIVDMMNGTIDCQSEENVGTKFTIVLDLPLSESSDSTKASDLNFEANLSSLNILVAEDNDLNWEIISELLAIHSITAKRAINGQVCLDMLKSAPKDKYNLILMDVQMPIMNGRETTKTIRKDSDENIKNIPIIGMTADAFAEDIAAGIASGMNGYVTKPVDMDKLFQEIKKVLDNR